MLHVEDKESVLDGRRLRFVAHGGHALLARRCDEVTRGANLEEIVRISTEEKARDDAAVRACQEERHRVLSVSQTLESCPKVGAAATDEVADTPQDRVHQRSPSATRARR